MEETNPGYLLEQVVDKESFIRFAEALADERERAQAVEKANLKTYVVDGAFDWKNSDISNFLYAALSYFESGPYHQPEEQPSWKMFAEFLYSGKIYE